MKRIISYFLILGKYLYWVWGLRTFPTLSMKYLFQLNIHCTCCTKPNNELLRFCKILVLVNLLQTFLEYTYPNRGNWAPFYNCTKARRSWRVYIPSQITRHARSHHDVHLPTSQLFEQADRLLVGIPCERLVIHLHDLVALVTVGTLLKPDWKIGGESILALKCW